MKQSFVLLFAVALCVSNATAQVALSPDFNAIITGSDITFTFELGPGSTHFCRVSY